MTPIELRAHDREIARKTLCAELRAVGLVAYAIEICLRSPDLEQTLRDARRDLNAKIAVNGATAELQLVRASLGRFWILVD